MAQILPDVLLAIEFRAVGWQLEQGDIVGDLQGMGCVPACPVHDDHGVAPDCDMAGYFKQMLVHRISVGKWQNECCPRTFGWADCAKDIRTGIALVGYSAWA